MNWEIVSTLVAKPNPGGALVSLGRMNRGAAIMREHGLSVNIGRVMFGKDFGSLVMYAGSANYEHHMKNMGAAMADPAFMALQAEISGLPASAFTDGLRVWRNVGEVDPEKYGFTNHRFYSVPGKNMADVLAMLPDVQALAAWCAPIGWSGLIVSASWALGPLARCFPARVGGIPARCAV